MQNSHISCNKVSHIVNWRFKLNKVPRQNGSTPKIEVICLTVSPTIHTFWEEFQLTCCHSSSSLGGSGGSRETKESRKGTWSTLAGLGRLGEGGGRRGVFRDETRGEHTDDEEDEDDEDEEQLPCLVKCFFCLREARLVRPEEQGLSSLDLLLCLLLLRLQARTLRASMLRLGNRRADLTCNVRDNPFYISLVITWVLT